MSRPISFTRSGVDAVDRQVEERLLPGLADRLLDLLGHLLDRLLDPGRVDPPVLQQTGSGRSCAISRRTGLKPERMTASGVSSMMTSIPVAASKARMFRPSRPMIRPFISSDGSGTALTTCSAT